MPAEAIYELHEGDDAGWPYIYFDQFQNKKIQAPEYGGDGKKVGGEKAINPTVAFPAHMGPNDLHFYTGKMFPAKYRNGAFVAPLPYPNQTTSLVVAGTSQISDNSRFTLSQRGNCGTPEFQEPIKVVSYYGSIKTFHARGSL